MAFGYGSDDVGVGLVLSLLLLVGLLVWLLSSGFRRWAAESSAWVLAFGGAGGVAVLAGLNEFAGRGMTSGLLVLFLVIPLSLLNCVLLAWRGWVSRRPHRPGWPLLLPLLLDLLFWSCRMFGLGIL